MTPAQASPPVTIASRIAFIAEVLGGVRQAADALGVAPSQPSRWLAGKSSPDPEKTMLVIDLDHVLAVATSVWHPSLIPGWLRSPNAHLGNIAPIDWLKRHGSAEVVAALRAEDEGAYA